MEVDNVCDDDGSGDDDDDEDDYVSGQINTEQVKASVKDKLLSLMQVKRQYHNNASKLVRD